MGSKRSLPSYTLSLLSLLSMDLILRTDERHPLPECPFDITISSLLLMIFTIMDLE